MRDKHLFATEMYQIAWGGLHPRCWCLDSILSALRHLTTSFENILGVLVNAYCVVVGLEASPLAVIEKDQINNKFNPTGLKVNNRMISNGSRD